MNAAPASSAAKHRTKKKYCNFFHFRAITVPMSWQGGASIPFSFVSLGAGQTAGKKQTLIAGSDAVAHNDISVKSGSDVFQFSFTTRREREIG